MIANARDASEPVLIGGILRFYDDYRNVWVECPVAVDLAAAIRKLDAAAADREKRHKARVKQLGDGAEALTADAPARRLSLRTSASPWEGPRFAFHLFLGMDRVWEGEATDDPCPDCRGEKLDPYTYCANCDRCGMDSDPRIRPPRSVREAIRRERRRDNLAGGTGGKVKSNGKH